MLAQPPVQHRRQKRPRQRERPGAANTAPAAAAVERLLLDQLLPSGDPRPGAAGAAARSLLALTSVASSRHHLAHASRAGAQIVAELGQRDRVPTLLRRIIRSSTGAEVTPHLLLGLLSRRHRRRRRRSSRLRLRLRLRLRRRRRRRRRQCSRCC